MPDITLTDGATLPVTLTADLQWSDEFDWRPVQQSVELSLTGAPIIDCGSVRGGRPITLVGSMSDGGWITRAQLDQLDGLSRVAGLQLTLTLRGVPRSVVFRHQDGAISAVPIVGYSDPDDSDFYAVTLRLMEI